MDVLQYTWFTIQMSDSLLNSTLKKGYLSSTSGASEAKKPVRTRRNSRPSSGCCQILLSSMNCMDLYSQWLHGANQISTKMHVLTSLLVSLLSFLPTVWRASDWGLSSEPLDGCIRKMCLLVAQQIFQPSYIWCCVTKTTGRRQLCCMDRTSQLVRCNQTLNVKRGSYLT